MNTIRLKKERKNIDKIDQQLFKLIKKRTIVVKKILNEKNVEKLDEISNLGLYNLNFKNKELMKFY